MRKILYQCSSETVPGKVTASITVINRPRSNPTSLVNGEIITGTEIEIEKTIRAYLKREPSDKKVIVTVLTGRGLVTKVYDAEI